VALHGLYLMTPLSLLAQKIRSNVRELEGPLKRVIAKLHILRVRANLQPDFVRESLKDLLACKIRLVKH